MFKFVFIHIIFLFLTYLIVFLIAFSTEKVKLVQIAIETAFLFELE